MPAALAYSEDISLELFFRTKNWDSARGLRGRISGGSLARGLRHLIPPLITNFESDLRWANIGQSVKLGWTVLNGGSQCNVSLTGRTSRVTLLIPSVPLVGSQSVTQDFNTRYTLIATSGGGRVSADVEVRVNPPQQSSPVLQLFWVMLVNKNSEANPCFTTTVLAKDKDQAKPRAEALNLGYTATVISEDQSTTACDSYYGL
jgi:hypothetical protein